VQALRDCLEIWRIMTTGPIPIVMSNICDPVKLSGVPLPAALAPFSATRSQHFLTHARAVGTSQVRPAQALANPTAVSAAMFTIPRTVVVGVRI
jgi:hypothetical protein